MSKLVPKFRIGAKIRKAANGLDVDEMGIPGANFGAQYKTPLYVDESLVDNNHPFENSNISIPRDSRQFVINKSGKEVDLLDKANRMLKGRKTFNNMDEVMAFLKSLGVNADGDIGNATMSAYWKSIKPKAVLFKAPVVQNLPEININTNVNPYVDRVFNRYGLKTVTPPPQPLI